MKYSAGTVAGLCNQMFHAALLVGVGLLGFPDSQNPGGGALPQREVVSVQRAPYSGLYGVHFTEKGGRGP